MNHAYRDDLLGLEFPGYYLTDESAARMHAEIDVQRPCQAYLWALPAMNLYSMREGSEREFGRGNHILPIWKGRLRATTKVTRPNSDVIYAMSYLDLKDGPVVIEAPAGVQGLLDDFWHRPITDVGQPGPDKGQGGKYLLLPPDHEGELAEPMWYRTERDGTDALAELESARGGFEAIGHVPDLIDSLGHAGRAFEMLGRPGDAMDCARKAVRLAEPDGPSARLVLALNSVAAQFMLARRASDGLPFSARAAAMAGDLGLERERFAVEHTRACLELVGGDTDTGLDLLDTSVEDLGSTGPAGRVTGLINLGTGAGEVRRYDVAIDALVECEATSLAHDNDAPVAYSRAWLARVAFEQARWDDAVAYASLVDATTANRRGYSLLTALGVLGRVRVRRGDPGGVGLLEETIAGFDGHELQYRWSPAAGLAEHHWLRGDLDAMVNVLAGPSDEALATESEWAHGELGYWMWKAGELDAPSARAAPPFAAQMVGDTDRAVQLWERVGCPYEVALARSEGAPATALDALATFDPLGAAPMAARVRSALRSAGVEGIPRGPSSTTRAHPLGLTGRQAEVLDLLVDGLSNAEIATRLFVSKNAVEHHVSAIYAKFGVETRAEAIAAVLA